MLHFSGTAASSLGCSSSCVGVGDKTLVPYGGKYCAKVFWGWELWGIRVGGRTQLLGEEVKGECNFCATTVKVPSTSPDFGI